MHPFVGAGQRSARKPSFLGEGRWLAEGQTDEGAMREAFPSPLRRREGFALRGEVLSQRWESTQRIAGDGSGWTLRVHIRLSPDPIYGGHPLNVVGPSRRATSGVLGCNPFRATGPWACKNFNNCGPISAPGGSNQLPGSIFRRRGGSQTRPPQRFPPLTVGAAFGRPRDRSFSPPANANSSIH